MTRPIVTRLRDATSTDIPGRGHSLGLVNESVGARRVAVHVNVLKPGPEGPYHFHADAENVYFILAGRGRVLIDGEEYIVERHDTVFIPPGVPHSVMSAGAEALELLEIYAPPAFDDFHEVELKR